jgi:hypothetical protein
MAHRNTGGIKMKKMVVFVALICACAVFAGRSPVGVSRHAGMETLSPLAMMQASRGLPTEAYDTF